MASAASMTVCASRATARPGVRWWAGPGRGRSCNRTNHSLQGHTGVDARSLSLRRSAGARKEDLL